MIVVVRTTNKTRRVVIPNFMLRRQSKEKIAGFKEFISIVPGILKEKKENRIFDLSTPWKQTYFNVDNIDYISFYFVPKELK